MKSIEKHTASQVKNANATEAFADVARLHTGYTGSTMVMLHSVADMANAAKSRTLSTAYTVSSVTGGGTLRSKYIAIATTEKTAYTTHTPMRNLKLENFWYPHPCGPHSSRVISSGPARPWRWLSIVANAVIEKSCGVDGGWETVLRLVGERSARGDVSGRS